MDLLSDILNSAGLKSRILEQRSLASGDSIRFPCERSMGFHVVIQGELQITYSQNKKQILKAGDCAFMSRGLHHELKALSKNEVIFVSGAYQLWNEPIHPVFDEVPDWWVLRSTERGAFDSIGETLKLLSLEISNPDLGSELVIQSVLDILFNLILRKLIKLSAQKKPNWSRATQDDKISKALKLLHSQYNENWSLNDLAKKVGISRAGLAQKFKAALGDTPLNYLTTVRMQHAMRLLSASGDKIEVIATAVGYSDAFSFSKAFKKRIGRSPREFRRLKHGDAPEVSELKVNFD